MRRHPFNRDDADLNQLKAELSDRLGRPVELLTSEPTDDEPDGVLIIEHPDSGEWLDVDPAVVADVVAGHTIPPPPPTLEELLAEKLKTARTPDDKLKVFQEWLDGSAQRQRQARADARERRSQMARMRREARSVK